jgi:dTDP-4-amino-4,6-dideoxy-D-galactose acyltransferase
MSGDAPCRFLEWDSEFFGQRIARVVPERLDGPGLAGARAWCREQAIACLYFLVDANAADSIRRAEDHGFHLVDIRVTLESGHRLTPAATEEASIRPGRPDDLPALLPIARTAHSASRFYSDPHFDRERCAALYELWLTKSFKDYAEAVLVAEDKGRAAGYITCHLRESKAGQIGLVGVDERARGHGFGRQLVAAALRWFAAHECERVRVVTQGGNVASQRLYQGCGFRAQQVQLWYHLWFSDPVP